MQIRILGHGDETMLAHVAPDLFDNEIDLERSIEFLNDPRHHLVVAIDDGLVVGFISAVDYVHPDKQRELWINEVSVAETHRRRGISKAMLDATLSLGRKLLCEEAWVLTEKSNTAAMALYESAGGTESAAVMFNYRLTR